MTKFSTEEAQTTLAKLEGWSLNAQGEITRTFALSGFVQALTFVNAVGLLAEAAQHHPDITINWRRVTLALTTHDASGLTDKDINLAEQINRLPMI